MIWIVKCNQNQHQISIKSAFQSFSFQAKSGELWKQVGAFVIQMIRISASELVATPLKMD